MPAAKGAINSFSKTIARENGRFGIRVNVVSPGATPPKEEDIGEMSMHYNRPGPAADPEAQKEILRLYSFTPPRYTRDIANTVAFLASDAAATLPGQTISVSAASAWLAKCMFG